MAETKVLGRGIVAIEAAKPGPRVGILHSVHGNEPCGRVALMQVLARHEIKAGGLVIIDANPEAALLGQRYVSADLNRMFTAKLLAQATPHHDLARAQYLATHIPRLHLDFAIDLHSTSSATRFPFAVGFDGSEPLMKHARVARITGWNQHLMAGTLAEWLCSNGTPTVTFECGQHHSPAAIEVAERVLLSVLSDLDVIDQCAKVSVQETPSFQVVEHVTVGDAASFVFRKPYSSFDRIAPDEIIARDCTREYTAPSERGYSVLMPGDQQAINAGTVPDAYYLIRAQSIAIDNFRAAVTKAWSRQSSSRWRESNPALGQCGVTALVAQDVLGGEILKTRCLGIWHFYNRINGNIIDFTKSQFKGEKIEYSNLLSDRTEAFGDTNARQYDHLRKAVAAHLETSDDTS